MAKVPKPCMYMESLLKNFYQIPVQVLGCGHSNQVPIFGKALLKYPYQSPDQILGCGHSTQIPVHGIMTQVFQLNPWSDIGLWAQYPNPYTGKSSLKYPYQIPDLILNYGHNSQIPAYGRIITQVSLPILNICSDIGLWAQYSHPSIWESITQVFLPKYSCSNIGLYNVYSVATTVKFCGKIIRRITQNISEKLQQTTTDPASVLAYTSE